ncbi:hypothetical protein ACH4SP_03725 [Streptomyces sp. NPDC021093]|uniref:hypothetical protein n=1 Tax=Streptomyces sp. NPDC021093 TaxID=3365112 RepID=UPI0037B7A8B9
MTTAAAFGGVLVATPMATAAVAMPAPGAVMTAEQEAALACTKGGYGKAEGWARCSGKTFKVRVWCTWAGGGESTQYRKNYNWATCNRGSVSGGSSAIEVIYR